MGHELRAAGLPPRRTPHPTPGTPPATRAPRLQPHAPRPQPRAPSLRPACAQPAPSLLPHAPQAFSASTAALAYAMEPLFAALFAAAILHESIHELQLLGGALVVRPLTTPAPTRSRNPTPTLLGGGGRGLVALAPRLSPSPSPRSSPQLLAPTAAPPRPPHPSAPNLPPAPSPPPWPHLTLASPGARQRAGRRRLDPSALVLQPALLSGSRGVSMHIYLGLSVPLSEGRGGVHDG